MNPEALERRCPRLGGNVTFGYCKICDGDKSPCFKVFDCWWERFDVVTYMEARLSPQVFDSLAKHRSPPNKVASLLELIQQAQERAAED